MYSIRAGIEIAKAMLGLTGCAGDIKGAPTTPPGTCEENPYDFSETSVACPTVVTTTIDYNNTDYYYKSDDSVGHTDVTIELTFKPGSPAAYTYSGTFYGIEVSEDSTFVKLEIYDDKSTSEIDGLIFCTGEDGTFSDQLIFSVSAPALGLTYYIGAQIDMDENYNITFIELYMANADLLDGDINNLWNDEYLDPALTLEDTSTTCE